VNSWAHAEPAAARPELPKLVFHPFALLRWRWGLREARRSADKELLRTSLPSLRLAWREAELTASKNRVSLGRSVRSIVRAADEGRYFPNGSLLADPVRVHAEAAKLTALAGRLLDLESPVTARGVLLTEHLLADGTGPLFAPERVDELSGYLDMTLEALEPLAPALR
jgi:hypothetical protein